MLTLKPHKKDIAAFNCNSSFCLIKPLSIIKVPQHALLDTVAHVEHSLINSDSTKLERPKGKLDSIIRQHTIPKGGNIGREVSGCAYVSLMSQLELDYATVMSKESQGISNKRPKKSKLMPRNNIKFQFVCVIADMLMVVEVGRYKSFRFATKKLNQEWSLTAYRTMNKSIIRIHAGNDGDCIDSNNIEFYDISNITQTDLQEQLVNRPVNAITRQLSPISTDIVELFNKHRINNGDNLRISSRSLEFCNE
ncbi:hypothetical protein [Photobacterium aquimaris]|uniref:Uncharacterized protein n=1 Tax=Photobacterium aquimaris TaxID=512643 RepID=A0A2T3I0J8_9GAMM|nr:hypothetical protein [Photobacterium aquimaris]OBU25601.1 hypothetical protein AYY21_08450 [Photobacterium aquimaris]PQJ37100.1 hypothetical protein BTN98_18335 [Photobacterium aquimaris]PSU10045.1 hypothetical protein C0W81_04800 [Photobacterium aquimaris]